jgi:hypothetical protein
VVCYAVLRNMQCLSMIHTHARKGGKKGGSPKIMDKNNTRALESVTGRTCSTINWSEYKSTPRIVLLSCALPVSRWKYNSVRIRQGDIISGLGVHVGYLLMHSGSGGLGLSAVAPSRASMLSCCINRASTSDRDFESKCVTIAPGKEASPSPPQPRISPHVS